MYNITENIYYSQLSSVAIVLQPEPVFTSYNTRKGFGSLSSAIALRSSPPSHVSNCNSQRNSQLFCDHCNQDVSFMKPEISLSCLLQPATGSYIGPAELVQSTPLYPKIHFNTILSSAARSSKWPLPFRYSD
jgi:hypothetical protein